MKQTGFTLEDAMILIGFVALAVIVTFLLRFFHQQHEKPEPEDEDDY